MRSNARSNSVISSFEDATSDDASRGESALVLRIGEVNDVEQAFELTPSMVRLPDGWAGPKSLRGASECFVLLQLQGGAFERVFPAERGTFDCRPENLLTVNVEPVSAAEQLDQNETKFETAPTRAFWI